MIEKNLHNEFDNLFKEGLENAAVTPPNGLWENLSSQISNPVVSTTITQTIITKTSAIWIKTSLIIAAVTASVAIVYQISKQEQTLRNETPKNSVVAPKIENKPIEADNELTLSSSQNTSSEKTLDNKINSTLKKSNNLSNNEKKQQDEQSHDHKLLDKKTSEITTQNERATESTNPIAPSKTIHNKDENELGEDNEIEALTTKPIKRDTIFKFIPNVVTPNNDGFNDVYLIDIKGETSFYLTIFNEKMERVFETTNKNKAWECKLPNGEDAPEGNYIVIVKYQLKNDTEKTEKTILKLIR